MKQRADQLAAKMGFGFDWDTEAGGLSPSAAQKLEIVKLLWRDSRIMVLDEPTAMLSPEDSDALYLSLKQLASEGATVIVVTHRIPEVVQHCESVTVLRGGRKVADLKVSDTSADELAELIVGHSIARTTQTAASLGPAVLEVHDLVVRGSRKHHALNGASFTILGGEVVGLAGVDGNGQRELFHSLIGTLRAESGKVTFRGDEITGIKARDRLRAGMRLIPEDRHEEGVVEDWSLTDNAALGLQRIPPLANGAWSDLHARHELAMSIADRFKTKHSGLHKSMRSLSGGNQQRFVAARALELKPWLILAFQPTRGLDVDGTTQVYSEIRGACRRGAAALVTSFDLDELLENCDRVLVINSGRVFEPTAEQRGDRQSIGRLMVGAN
jgi:simple sugar transport system ATP-binding protein